MMENNDNDNDLITTIAIAIATNDNNINTTSTPIDSVDGVEGTAADDEVIKVIFATSSSVGEDDGDDKEDDTADSSIVEVEYDYINGTEEEGEEIDVSKDFREVISFFKENYGDIDNLHPGKISVADGSSFSYLRYNAEETNNEVLLKSRKYVLIPMINLCNKWSSSSTVPVTTTAGTKYYNTLFVSFISEFTEAVCASLSHLGELVSLEEIASTSTTEKKNGEGEDVGVDVGVGNVGGGINLDIKHDENLTKITKIMEFQQMKNEVIYRDNFVSSINVGEGSYPHEVDEHYKILLTTIINFIRRPMTVEEVGEYILDPIDQASTFNRSTQKTSNQSHVQPIHLSGDHLVVDGFDFKGRLTKNMIKRYIKCQLKWFFCEGVLGESKEINAKEIYNATLNDYFRTMSKYRN